MSLPWAGATNVWVLSRNEASPRVGRRPVSESQTGVVSWRVMRVSAFLAMIGLQTERDRDKQGQTGTRFS